MEKCLLQVVKNGLKVVKVLEKAQKCLDGDNAYVQTY